MKVSKHTILNHDEHCRCGLRIAGAPAEAIVALKQSMPADTVGVVLLSKPDASGSHVMTVPLGEISKRDAAQLLARIATALRAEADDEEHDGGGGAAA